MLHIVLVYRKSYLCHKADNSTKQINVENTYPRRSLKQNYRYFCLPKWTTFENIQLCSPAYIIFSYAALHIEYSVMQPGISVPSNLPYSKTESDVKVNSVLALLLFTVALKCMRQ